MIYTLYMTLLGILRPGTYSSRKCFNQSVSLSARFTSEDIFHPLRAYCYKYKSLKGNALITNVLNVILGGTRI